MVILYHAGVVRFAEMLHGEGELLSATNDRSNRTFMDNARNLDAGRLKDKVVRSIFQAVMTAGEEHRNEHVS